MRRLYSTFAGGWPGFGLILMRLVVGIALVDSAGSPLLSSPAVPMTVLSVLLAAAAIFLVIGLYTPIVGTMVAVVESCRLVVMPADRLVYLLLASVVSDSSRPDMRPRNRISSENYTFRMIGREPLDDRMAYI